jgi:hypothetical protein
MNHILDLLLAIGLTILGIAAIIFWIRILVRAATLPSSSDKIVWVLIILFTGIIGAAIFFFAGPSEDKVGADGLTDEDRQLLREMREEFENGPGSRPRMVLTPEEEKLVNDYRRAYHGDM